MKKIVVQRSVFSPYPVLALCLALLFPLVTPLAAQADPSGEAIIVAAEGSGNMPVIPQVPERSRRAPRRPPASQVTPDEADVVPTPVTPAPAPMATPRQPQPEPVIDEPSFEPVSAPAPRPVAAKPRVRRTTASGRTDISKVVINPAPADPYVTKEFYVGAPPSEMYGYRNRPVWLVDVPTPGPGPAPVPVYGVPSPPPASMLGGGTVIHQGGVARYSTQPLAVSNPLPQEPMTYTTQYYGQPVGVTPRGVGGYGAYPGTVMGSPWPSENAVVYVDVPPERVSQPLGSERPRYRLSDTPALPADRISDQTSLEPDPYKVRPLRPRR